MNFWEARQAALEGKKVKRVLTGSVFTPNQMLDPDYAWYVAHFEGEWEIVEEPKPITAFINVYSHPVNWVPRSTVEDSNKGASEDRLGCLEIVTDENGKLISAKNVDTNR